MNQERREKAIAWLKEEIRSLKLAPELNGCPMTPEWAAQLEIMRTCLEAVQDHFPDTTKMVKLTLEQLREMDGRPVWVEEVEHWALIDVEKGGQWDGAPFAVWAENGVKFTYNVESRDLHCYRRPPEGEV